MFFYILNTIFCHTNFLLLFKQCLKILVSIRFKHNYTCTELLMTVKKGKSNADQRLYLFVAGELQDYRDRTKVFQTPTEIVEVLKVLIFHNEIQDPQVYDGSLKRRVSSIFMLQ